MSEPAVKRSRTTEAGDDSTSEVLTANIKAIDDKVEVCLTTVGGTVLKEYSLPSIATLLDLHELITKDLKPLWHRSIFHSDDGSEMKMESGVCLRDHVRLSCQGELAPPSFMTKDNPDKDDYVKTKCKRLFTNDHDQHKTEWSFHCSKITKHVRMDGIRGFYFEVVSTCEFVYPTSLKAQEILMNNRDNPRVLYGIGHNCPEGYSSQFFFEGGCPETKSLTFYYNPNDIEKGLQEKDPDPVPPLYEVTLSGGPALEDVATLWAGEDKARFFRVKIMVGADSEPLLCERVILSQASGYLNEKLGVVFANAGDESKKAEKIELPTISAGTMAKVLDFVYTGSCTVPAGAAEAFMDAVNLLRMPLLQSKIKDEWKPEIERPSPTSMCSWLKGVGFDSWGWDVSEDGQLSEYEQAFAEDATCHGGLDQFVVPKLREKGEENEISVVNGIVNSLMKEMEDEADNAGKSLKEALQKQGRPPRKVLAAWALSALETYDSVFPQTKIPSQWWRDWSFDDFELPTPTNNAVEASEDDSDAGGGDGDSDSS